MTTPTQKHPDERYVNVDLFPFEEAEIRCRTVKMRNARSSHVCFGGQGDGKDNHLIKPGQRYREERALVDGDFWGRYCMCIPCLDKHIAVYEDGEDDDE